MICATSCGSGPSVEPTPVIEGPTVSCPSDVSVIAHAGQQPTVSFDTPIASKGSAPITIVCMPASGTQFPNGTTTITCEATDSRQHKGSCTFSVIVTPIPQLAKTTFLAFGDSLTEGKTASLLPTIVKVPPNTTNFSTSYVEQLNTKLSQRYQDQTIILIAFGKGAEQAGEGKLRLRDNWGLFVPNPDAMLLLEGINDLLQIETASAAGMASAIDSVIDALRYDIGTARGHGTRVFLATLPPVTPPKPANVVAAVPVLNTRIQALAAEQNVTLVDLYTAMDSSLVGSDGLHLKPEGYGAVADEWMKAIQAALEVTTVAP